jgi:hypothetical protein
MNSKAAMTSNAPKAAPTPIPAFAPVDNPLLLGIGDAVVVGVVVVVEVLEVLLIGGGLMLECWAGDEVGWVVEEDVVEKSERSVC